MQESECVHGKSWGKEGEAKVRSEAQRVEGVNDSSAGIEGEEAERRCNTSRQSGSGCWSKIPRR